MTHSQVLHFSRGLHLKNAKDHLVVLPFCNRNCLSFLGGGGSLAMGAPIVKGRGGKHDPLPYDSLHGCS